MLELCKQVIITLKRAPKKMVKKKKEEFKDEIFSLITNIISYAHGKILFQTQKHSYISRNMENSWVSMLTEGNIMAMDSKHDNCYLSLSAVKSSSLQQKYCISQFCCFNISFTYLSSVSLDKQLHVW